MQLRDLDPTSSSAGWDEKWSDIFDQYQNDIRHAYYIHAVAQQGEHHLLEIGAGSFRDMAELRRRGINCEGIDFSQESVNKAKSYFKEHESVIQHASAFDMPFADNTFDLSYHNGFWILFSDQQIKLLAIEQARISRSRMIATVHNAHNKNFIEYFDSKKINDPLFDIRFFHVDEMVELMRDTCSSVTVIPVGKGKQHHEDALIRDGVTDPKVIKALFDSCGHQHLETSERLLCIGTVR